MVKKYQDSKAFLIDPNPEETITFKQEFVMYKLITT